MPADFPALVARLRQGGSFAVVSGIGWLLDFAIFTVLLWWTVPTALANGIGATLAVTFVYFTSVKAVFSYRGGFLYSKFLIYLCYQAVAVVAASLAIAWLERAASIHGLLAKVIVTPVTFVANYLFMVLLVGRRSPAAGGLSDA